MNRRSFVTALAGGALGAAAAPGKRPNIIFLLVDDLGWRDFGCYGNRYYETPNIDRLAADGVRFTNAYAACPVCSPTRASIMTGKYPARLHLTDWIPGRKQGPVKLVTPQFEQQLPLAETTIAEALKPLGYASASIGKWHLGGQGFTPDHQGFDLNIAGNERGSPPRYFGPFDLPNLKAASKDEWLTERLSDAADAFIEKSYKQGPFFLYMPEFAVHIPLQAREEVAEKYRRKGDPERNPVYAALVESVDVALGRLRKTLDRMGIADNTVVIVNSDNGGLRYEGRAPKPVTDNSPLRAGKGHLYEGGIREPLLMYWPGVTKAGRVIDEPVSSIDYLPTAVDIAGGKTAAGAVDGVNLVPLLRGQNHLKSRDLFWHYPHYSNQGGVPGGAVRHGDYKLIEFYEDGRLELFNLKEDIGERVNVVNKRADVARDLHERLKKWRAEVKASMPSENPGYDPVRADEGQTGYEPKTKPA